MMLQHTIIPKVNKTTTFHLARWLKICSPMTRFKIAGSAFAEVLFGYRLAMAK